MCAGKECNSYLGCNCGSCAGCKSECSNYNCEAKSHASYSCKNGDIYWKDSCGNWEGKKSECGSAGCTSGAISCSTGCVDFNPSNVQGLPWPTAYKGKSYSGKIKMWNEGTKDFTGSNVDMAIAISSSSSLSSVKCYLEFVDIPKIDADDYEYINFSVTIYGNCPTGDYYFLFYADSGGKVSECDEGNNSKTVPVKIQ